MAICQVTGKRTVFGNNVSHSKRRTRRPFKSNIHKKRFWLAEENRWVRLCVSAKGIRIITKKGLKAVLDAIRARGEKV